VVCKRGLFIQELGQRPLVRLVEPVDAQVNLTGIEPIATSIASGYHRPKKSHQYYTLASQVPQLELEKLVLRRVYHVIIGTFGVLTNDEVCQSAYGLLSRIGSYGSIRIPLSMFCSTRQSLCVFTRTSEGKAEHATVALEDELASRSIVDA